MGLSLEYRVHAAFLIDGSVPRKGRLKAVLRTRRFGVPPLRRLRRGRTYFLSIGEHRAARSRIEPSLHPRALRLRATAVPAWRISQVRFVRDAAQCPDVGAGGPLRLNAGRARHDLRWIWSNTLRASSISINCGARSSEGVQPENSRPDQYDDTVPKRIVPRPPVLSFNCTSGNRSRLRAVTLANGAFRKIRIRWFVTAYRMRRRIQASSRKRPATRYNPISTNGMPHNFMKIGAPVASTLDSQKIANPAHSRLNGINSQSRPVNSNPWAGCPHQTIFSPSSRRPVRSLVSIPAPHRHVGKAGSLTMYAARINSGCHACGIPNAQVWSPAFTAAPSRADLLSF